MFEQAFKNIDDILHKDAGCASELDYTEPQLEGRKYAHIIDAPYRWEA